MFGKGKFSDKHVRRKKRERRTYKEINGLENPSITSVIRRQRIKRLDHVLRMPHDRATEQFLTRGRWLDTGED